MGPDLYFKPLRCPEPLLPIMMTTYFSRPTASWCRCRARGFRSAIKATQKVYCSKDAASERHSPARVARTSGGAPGKRVLPRCGRGIAVPGHQAVLARDDFASHRLGFRGLRVPGRRKLIPAADLREMGEFANSASRDLTGSWSVTRAAEK
jgi:hypothetical protein